MVLSKDLLPWMPWRWDDGPQWLSSFSYPYADECMYMWAMTTSVGPNVREHGISCPNCIKIGRSTKTRWWNILFIQFLWRYLEGLWFFTVAVRHRLPVGALARALTALAKAKKFLEQKIGLENRGKIWRKTQEIDCNCPFLNHEIVCMIHVIWDVHF